MGWPVQRAWDESDAGTNHAVPYNPAFAMIRSVQATVDELFQTLRAEQQQRAQDVAELRCEVVSLNIRVTRHDEQLNHPSFSLKDDTALRQSDLEQLDLVLQQASALSNELRILKKLHEARFAALEDELPKERNERQQQHKELMGKLSAVVSSGRQPVQAEQQHRDGLLLDAEEDDDSPPITPSAKAGINSPMILRGRGTPIPSSSETHRGALKSPKFGRRPHDGVRFG